MSALKRNDAALVGVDSSLADVLRRQTLVTLEANAYFFEEILEFGPDAQLALAKRYRDAFAVLDAIGWRRPDDPVTVDVPVTFGFVEQLLRRRYELGHGIIDRLPTLDAEPDPAARAAIQRTIVADREAAFALDGIIARATLAL